MFLLQDLPTLANYARFEKAYGDFNAEAVILFLTVLRCASDLMVALDTFLGRHGLTHGRWITLVLLKREDSRAARPMVLAEKQGVTRATMTGLLKSLEADGLVERRVEAGDGRGAMVFLTAKGSDLLAEIMPDYYARIGEMLEGAPDDQMSEATELLSYLLGRADRLSRI